MLPYLDSNSPFPSTELALDEPNGLLAAGADLSKERLVNAYSNGIFPWYSSGEPILWWSPDPRCVFNIPNFKPSRSLCRLIKKEQFVATLNKDFKQVIDLCAQPTSERPSTWITNDMKLAYGELHKEGFAHSLEIWKNSKLVGGIYGVSIGKLFCGESMFSRISNGSKIALSCLIGYLKTNNFGLLDAQVENQHLFSLGAISMTRREYIENTKKLTSQPVKNDLWSTKELSLATLISRS